MKFGLLCLVLVIMSYGFAFGQGTYTQIDPPGSIMTLCFGIDSAGDIVGYYEDASFVNHGFIFSLGSYITVDYPENTSTYLSGINDSGQIVGGAGTGNGPEFGFLYDWPTQTFVENISYPGSSATGTTAINNSGAIVGYFAATVNGQENEYGFGLVGSTYYRISPPKGGQSIQARGVTSFNGVVGDSNRFGNFSFNRGVYRHIDIPNHSSAEVLGVNPSGTGVVGSNGGSTGFLYSNGRFVTLKFPEADSTTVLGVNSSNEVTGYFSTVDGYHGFTWTPPSH